MASAAASAAASAPCTVTRLQSPKNDGEILRLANVAEAQYNRNKNYNLIYPWRSSRTTPLIHYVAHAKRADGSTVICGWLTTKYEEAHGNRCAYLVEIATRRIKDAYYGGVGQQLHQAFLADAAAAHMDFAYLFPLNEKVQAMYESPAWGYTHVPDRPKIKFMFRPIPGGKAPTEAFLAEHEHTKTDLEELLEVLHEIANARPPSKTLKELIETVTPVIATRAHLRAELRDAVMIAALESLGPQRRMIADAIKEILRSVGKRVTRKSTVKKTAASRRSKRRNTFRN